MDAFINAIYIPIKLKLKYSFGFQVHLQMDFSKQIQEYIYFKEKVFSIKVFEDWHFRVQKKSFGCVKLKKEFQHSICQRDLLCVVPSLLNYFSNYSFRRLLIPLYYLEFKNYQLLFTVLFICL
ncbi:unnamed protein product [Paramecium octaurelia]|uniref:Uncharacterized protein n=1 Tax=Paramecium octaurelia TaxID=43137 RepID=A0A8S1TIJ4_PAROT|nr:unnamed protein product [Paramecium octaurelia]